MPFLQEEKGAIEDEMVGWHHQLNGHESEQTLEHSEEQGGLMCYSPGDHNKSDTTESLNNKDIIQFYKTSCSYFFF